MKNILLLTIFISSSVFLHAQKDTLVLQTAKGRTSQLFPGSYGIRGKVQTGVAGTYKTGQAEGRVGDNDTASLRIFQAISNRFPINTLVLVTNPANGKKVIAGIADALGSRSKKEGNLIDLDKPGIGLLGLNKKNKFKIKVEIIILNDSLTALHKILDTIPIFDSTKIVDSNSANSFKVIGKAVNGIASFYSSNLDGTLTATGEIFRQRKLTAASNNFKLNTWVLVTNLKNKKSVIVRINDRMHPRMKKKGRVVDLTMAAAALLDFMNAGLTKVKVEPVKFVKEPVKTNPLDSLIALQKNDSLAVADSVKLDSLKLDVNTVTGIASFYSSNLDGTKTATGETFRNNKLSAASNNFDLNTWVKITNLKNNKYVILRINDRMHPRMKKRGRVVDLSRAAARRLDFIKSGLTKVKVEVVSKDALE